MASKNQSSPRNQLNIPLTFLPLGRVPQKIQVSFKSPEEITWNNLRQQLKIENITLPDPNINVKILNISTGKFKVVSTDSEVRRLIDDHTYIKLSKKRASKKLSSSSENLVQQNSPRSEHSNASSTQGSVQIQELSSYQNEQLPVSTRPTRVPSSASPQDRSTNSELGSYNNVVLPEAKAKPQPPTHHDTRISSSQTHTAQTPITESSYNNEPVDTRSTSTSESSYNKLNTPAQVISESSYNNAVPPTKSTQPAAPHQLTSENSYNNLSVPSTQTNQPVTDSSYNNEPYEEPSNSPSIDNSYGNVEPVRKISSAERTPLVHSSSSSRSATLTHSDSNSSLYGNASKVAAPQPPSHPHAPHRSHSEVLPSHKEDALLRNAYAATSSDHLNKHTNLTHSSPANPNPSASKKAASKDDPLLRNSYAVSSPSPKQATAPKKSSTPPVKSAYATSASQITSSQVASPNTHRKLRERHDTKYTDIDQVPPQETEHAGTCYANNLEEESPSNVEQMEQIEAEEDSPSRIKTSLKHTVINHALYDTVDEIQNLYIRQVDVTPSEPATPKILVRVPSARKVDRYDEDSDSEKEKHETETVLLSNGRDWNAEYQALVEKALQSGSSCEALEDGHLWGKYYRIAQEFSDTANLYAKIIISEMCLPIEQRTIKPVDVGGVAGGQKYIFHNILFKFALDSMVFNDPPMWMYGGTNGPDDEHAVKAAKNELKGLEAYSTMYSGNLSFPMMAVIDYKGYRLVAMSVLPVNKQTIKYGSNDSGVTIHADIPEINQKMEFVAKQLNLKGHMTGLRRDAKKMIYGPGDIEAHLGTDGRHYVLDFGRVFPPEDPSYRNDPNKRSVFYNLLRPEFVKSYPKPLCSDAFTSWNSDDDPNERALNNAEVSEATFVLYNEIIPQFATELGSNATTVQRVARLLGSKTLAIEDAKWMLDLVGTQALHQRGMSLRHLGEIRYHTTEPNMRKLLLSVCVGRVIKDQLRQTMREKMKKAQVPSDEPFRRAIVKCLNTLLGRTKQGIQFWEELLPNKLEIKYPRCFSEDEVDALSSRSLDLCTSVDLRVALTLMMEVAGIKLKNTAVREMLSNIEDFKIVVADIKSLDSKTKHRSMIYMSGGMTILAQTQRMIQKSKPGEVKAEIERQLQLALHQFQTAHRAAPSCPMIMFNWGKTAKINANYALRKGVHPDDVYQKVYDVLDASIMKIPKHLQLYSRTIREHVRALQKLTEPNHERIRGLLAVAEEKESRLAELDDDSDRCFLDERPGLAKIGNPEHF